MPFGVLRNDQEGTAVPESRADVETILAAEVSGETCAYFFVDYDTESKGDNGSGVLIKGEVEGTSKLGCEG